MPPLMNSVHGEPEVLPLKPVETILPIPPSPKPSEKRIARKQPIRLLGVLGHFFAKEKRKSDRPDEEVLELAQKHPENAAFQLKLADVYQRKGEEERAIGRYLQAAEVFRRENFLIQAMAIYKKVLSINPHLILANQRMGEMYLEMGYFSEAIDQYRIMVKHYEKWGKRERVLGILTLIQELETEKALQEKRAATRASQEPFESQGGGKNLSLSKPVPGAHGPQSRILPGEKRDQGFDLVAELSMKGPGDLMDRKEVSTEKRSGFEEIFKELQETVILAEVYPDFNLQMGKACMQMGFNDGAIEQFQAALEKGQKPAEAARLLSQCYREKGWFHEARQCYEKAMEIESNRQAKNPITQSDPGMDCG